MAFKSLDSSFSDILEMNMRGNKLVGDLFLGKGLLEEITRFIVNYLDIGILTSSSECVQEFLDSFGDACT